jgi:protein-S-isoprenylcysteine O-methyltransferase Ste14
MEQLLKIYLPIYLILYFLLAFILPTYLTYKRTGINPITFGKNDNAHDYIGFVMKILMLLLSITIFLFALNKTLYYYSTPINYLENDTLKNIGLVLIHISLVWIAIAQYQMSNSWRIGIDETNKTELKTKGIFSISRNPIFLGMIISVIGIFLIIPNAITFFLTLTTYFIIQIQVRLEEAFLLKQHGADYANYLKNVKRFI